MLEKVVLVGFLSLKEDVIGPMVSRRSLKYRFQSDIQFYSSIAATAGEKNTSTQFSPSILEQLPPQSPPPASPQMQLHGFNLSALSTYFGHIRFVTILPKALKTANMQTREHFREEK